MTKESLGAMTANFFRDFDAAFQSFSGKIVAERYQAPYLAIRSDGTSECFLSADEVSGYFQDLLENYRNVGARKCAHKDLEYVIVGEASVFATVTWSLLGSRGNVVESWRESYNLALSGGRLLAFASVDHA